MKGPAIITQWIPVVTATTLVFASCSPHKVKLNPPPPIEMPDGYQTIQAEGDNLPDRWWQDFGDPQLNALVERALYGNLQVKAAWERLSQARTIAAQAGTARFPQINLSANHTISEPANNFVPSAPISLEASYELDVFRQFGSTAAAAAKDASSARDQVESLAMSLVAQIAETYFALRTQQARLLLLDEQIQVSQNFVELAEMRLGQGLGSSLDLLQQRQQLAATGAQRPLAESAIAVLQNQLAVLTGQSPGAIALRGDPKLPALPPKPSTGLPADLLMRRPDVRAARRQVESADYQVAVAVANRLPKLRLSGSYGPFQRIDTTFSTGAIWNVVAGLFVPIFQGGRLKAEVKRTESVVRERSYNYGQALLQAILEVENALIQESKQGEYLVELRDRLVIAEETLEEARQRYSAGIGDQSFLQILTALSTAQQVQQLLLLAEQQALSYRIQLCRALGGSWTHELDPKAKDVNEVAYSRRTARTKQ